MKHRNDEEIKEILIWVFSPIIILLAGMKRFWNS